MTSKLFDILVEASAEPASVEGSIAAAVAAKPAGQESSSPPKWRRNRAIRPQALAAGKVVFGILLMAVAIGFLAYLFSMTETDLRSSAW